MSEAKIRRRKTTTTTASLPRSAEDHGAPHGRFTGTAISSSLLDETLAFWQPHAKRALTREDAREIVHNLTGFFAVLREWQVAEAAGAGSKETPQDGSVTG